MTSLLSLNTNIEVYVKLGMVSSISDMVIGHSIRHLNQHPSKVESAEF